jgi:hypothetical protein
MRIALAIIAVGILILATAWAYWFFATPIIYEAPEREVLPSVLLETPASTPTDLTPQN